jgi:hypothetical protein
MKGVSVFAKKDGTTKLEDKITAALNKNAGAGKKLYL